MQFVLPHGGRHVHELRCRFDNYCHLITLEFDVRIRQLQKAAANYQTALPRDLYVNPIDLCGAPARRRPADPHFRYCRPNPRAVESTGCGPRYEHTRSFTRQCSVRCIRYPHSLRGILPFLDIIIRHDRSTASNQMQNLNAMAPAPDDGGKVESYGPSKKSNP